MTQTEAKKFMFLVGLKERRNEAMFKIQEITEEFKRTRRIKKDGCIYKVDVQRWVAAKAPLKQIIDRCSHLYWRARKTEKRMDLAPMFKKNFNFWNSYEDIQLAKAKKALKVSA